MPRTPAGPPPGARVSTVTHRVPFYETDAMKIVHHSNYVRYLELARIQWLDEHHRPYREYVAEGLHFATTHVDVRYHRSAVYDDVVAITTWLDRVTGASIRMAYELRVGETVVVTGSTEHAMVNDEGRVRRIPKDQRTTLQTLSPN